MKNTNVFLAFAIPLVLIGLVIGAVATKRQVEAPAAGAIGDEFQLEIPTSSLVFAGHQADTSVLATGTARRSLEVQNISTSTAQPLYCNFNDKPSSTSTPGFIVNASSSRVVENYRGALRCRFPNATSGIAVIER